MKILVLIFAIVFTNTLFSASVFAQATPPVPASPADTAAHPEDGNTKVDTTATMKGSTHKPRVFFISPKDHAKVGSPVKMKFGVEGYKVKPAGSVDELTGHHHVIIDGDPTPTGDIVSADETHIHYGKGQTSGEIKLSSGEHTLTLQFADGAHKSYGPAMSQTIHITVK